MLIEKAQRQTKGSVLRGLARKLVSLFRDLPAGLINRFLSRFLLLQSGVIARALRRAFRSRFPLQG